MAKGDKKPVVMTGDIDSTVAKKLHAAQHKAGGVDPITAADVGAVKYEYYGGNMNDLVTDGHYRLNTNANLPGYAYYGQCIVTRGNTMDTVAQIAFGIPSQGKTHCAIFRSGKLNSAGVWTWEEWAQITTTDYAVNKAGDTMTGKLTIQGEGYKNQLVVERRGSEGDVVIDFSQNNSFVGLIGFSREGKAFLRGTTDASSAYNYLLHTGNKPSGSYTGNGDATTRVIATGGNGDVCAVYRGGAFALVTYAGALCLYASGEVVFLDDDYAYFSNGTLYISTNNAVLNHSGAVNKYQVL